MFDQQPRRTTPPADQPPSGLLGFLDCLETLGRRMIIGIGRFLTHVLPDWLARQLAHLGRIAVKSVRVLAVLAVWGALTFSPLLLLAWLEHPLPVVLGLTWAALALAGSLWGALYVRRRASAAHFSAASQNNGGNRS
jgi:hypothetical protein